jgi:heme-degrading monooxygenase HmoA
VIIEHALLTVHPDSRPEFEAAFTEATELISVVPGFQSLILSACAERSDTYLLLVAWDTLEDHTQGFRGSAEYARWSALLHPFYDPFPTVQHFSPVVCVPVRSASR